MFYYIAAETTVTRAVKWSTRLIVFYIHHQVVGSDTQSMNTVNLHTLALDTGHSPPNKESTIHTRQDTNIELRLPFLV